MNWIVALITVKWANRQIEKNLNTSEKIEIKMIGPHQFFLKIIRKPEIKIKTLITIEECIPTLKTPRKPISLHLLVINSLRMFRTRIIYKNQGHKILLVETYCQMMMPLLVRDQTRILMKRSRKKCQQNPHKHCKKSAKRYSTVSIHA